MKCRYTALVSLALSLALAASLSTSACSLLPVQVPSQKTPSPEVTDEVTIPNSYDDLYGSLHSFTEEQKALAENSLSGSTTEDMGFFSLDNSEAADSSENLTAENASAASSTDYTSTNVQVEGVDEGDVVKTDGENIYQISEDRVVISEAAGDRTRELASFSLDENQDDSSSTDEVAPSDTTTSDTADTTVDTAPSYPQSYPTELYIEGDILAVIHGLSNVIPLESESTQDDDAGSSWRGGYGSESTQVAFYDVTDPTDPSLITTLGQGGYYSSSRLYDGVLYLISNYYIYDFDNADQQKPETYAPALYQDGEAALVEAKDICIIPEYDATAYTVVSTINIADASRYDTKSVLGGNGVVYMNQDGLYIANSVYETIESEPYNESVYTITDYTNTTTTRITRFSLGRGTIEVGASGKVAGSLLNQFSLDEYEDHLRVVTTNNDYSYRILRDETFGVESYEYDEEESLSTNALYVLDQNLKTVGSIEGLAEDERVYSVRFDGPVGYFVTFKQVDPLFTVDLANPEQPEILSALKIPGFSQYLHVYSPGRLFGLGMAADEDTGATQGMKLSMFDTTDPLNVTEKTQESTDTGYSEALYNHKAVCIAPERDTIGFPTENAYAVYGYSDEEGFYLRKEIALPTYAYNTRAFYAGDYFYVCNSSSIGVFSLDTFAEVTWITIT